MAAGVHCHVRSPDRGQYLRDTLSLHQGLALGSLSHVSSWASGVHKVMWIHLQVELWGVVRTATVLPPPPPAPCHRPLHAHLRINAMVSLRSFPWNGNDPVSISNCRATENPLSQLRRWSPGVSQHQLHLPTESRPTLCRVAGGMLSERAATLQWAKETGPWGLDWVLQAATFRQLGPLVPSGC